MSYQTQREKVKTMVEEKIIPAIRLGKDLDYNLVLEALASNCGTSLSMAEEVLRGFMQTKQIKEIRILTICDEQIVDFLKEVKLKELKDSKEAEQIIRGLE